MNKKNSVTYNPHLTTFIPEIIPYDQKAYSVLAEYIDKELRSTLTPGDVKKIIAILDDPTHEYVTNWEVDYEIIKMLLAHFLPKIKDTLGINKLNTLSKRITSQEPVLQLNGEIKEETLQIFSTNTSLDRFIDQQLDLYMTNKHNWNMLTEVFQTWSEKWYIDKTKPYELKVKAVESTQKTIIANILTLMILKEELGGKEKH